MTSPAFPYVAFDHVQPVRCSVLTEHRTPTTLKSVDTEALVVDAFAQLGIDALELTGGSDSGADLMVETDGVRAVLELKRRTLVTGSDAEQALRARTSPSVTLLIVADRVTEAARTVLTTRRAGYYDLRGRLAMRTDGMIIDAAVTPLRERPQRASALSGKAGLEIASAVLMRPGRATSVRDLARQLGRSASTVSEVLSALRRDGLVDAGNAVTDSRLFWQVADRWTAPRTYLAHLPSPGEAPVARSLRLGLQDVESETGWALTDSAAAAVLGAPLAFRSGQILDFYVPDQATQHRATTLLGVAAKPAQARASVRIAPVPAVVRHRVGLHPNPVGWPTAHPLFVALDLAQDIGRGREILEAWTPDGPWARVW